MSYSYSYSYQLNCQGIFFEQPAGALPFHLEGEKNELYKSGHILIIVVTCQNHSKTKTKNVLSGSARIAGA
jgi:hypothetical protein